MLDKMLDVSGEIKDVQYFLREAYIGLLLQLSKDWISYEIEFQGEKFLFEPPMTLKEKEKQEQDKKRFIELLLKDAMNLAVEEAMSDGPEIDMFDDRSPFYKLNFLRALDVDKEQYESPIVPESYQELKDEAAKAGGSKPLDKDSYWVKMAFSKKGLADFDKIIKRWIKGKDHVS